MPTIPQSEGYPVPTLFPKHVLKTMPKEECWEIWILLCPDVTFLTLIMNAIIKTDCLDKKLCWLEFKRDKIQILRKSCMRHLQEGLKKSSVKNLKYSQRLTSAEGGKILRPSLQSLEELAHPEDSSKHLQNLPT